MSKVNLNIEYIGINDNGVHAYKLSIPAKCALRGCEYKKLLKDGVDKLLDEFWKDKSIKRIDIALSYKLVNRRHTNGYTQYITYDEDSTYPYKWVDDIDNFLNEDPSISKPASKGVIFNIQCSTLLVHDALHGVDVDRLNNVLSNIKTSRDVNGQSCSYKFNLSAYLTKHGSTSLVFDNYTIVNIVQYILMHMGAPKVSPHCIYCLFKCHIVKKYDKLSITFADYDKDITYHCAEFTLYDLLTYLSNDNYTELIKRCNIQLNEDESILLYGSRGVVYINKPRG